MKFSKTRPVKIVMLGAGGTGGHVAPHLYRLLYALKRPVRFIIADGDVTEPKNLVRQNFTEADLGANKARVLAERYSTAFGLETAYIPHFIESDVELAKLVTPGDCITGKGTHYDGDAGDFVPDTEPEQVILIGCVDNNKSRQLCHRVFMAAKELIYIDSGNGEYTGQVVCGIRRGGRTYYKPVAQLYPELMEATDLFPSELSCAEASVSAPQTIVANLMAATAVVNLVYNILVVGSCTTQQVTFSTKTVGIRATTHKQRRKAA